MIAASVGGRIFRIDAVLCRDEAWIDRFFCLFIGGGVEPVRVLVRAPSCEAAIDLLIESDHGRPLRISDDELWTRDSDYLCDACRAQLELAPEDRDFEHCECSYWTTGDGTPANLEWLDVAGEPDSIDFFAAPPRPTSPPPRSSSSTGLASADAEEASDAEERKGAR